MSARVWRRRRRKRGGGDIRRLQDLVHALWPQCALYQVSHCDGADEGAETGILTLLLGGALFEDLCWTEGRLQAALSAGHAGCTGQHGEHTMVLLAQLKQNKSPGCAREGIVVDRASDSKRRGGMEWVGWIGSFANDPSQSGTAVNKSSPTFHGLFAMTAAKRWELGFTARDSWQN